jgi:hypothetical protein
VTSAGVFGCRHQLVDRGDRFFLAIHGTTFHGLGSFGVKFDRCVRIIVY